MSTADDDLQTFETGISILFNEPEINVGDYGEKLVVEFPGLEAIQLHIPDVDPKNTSLFAHHVWKASILLSKLIIECDIKGLDVLELGAGTGIPSIVSSKLGAKVTASDYPDPEILSKLKLNFKKNIPGNEWHVIGHIWGQRGEDDLFPGNSSKKIYDMILMADTLWMRHQHENLIRDLKDLLSPGGIVIGVCGLHSGRECVDAFFRDVGEFFEIDYFIPTLIPIGSGFCENKDWEVIHESFVSNEPSERNRFLYKYKLTKKKPVNNIQNE